MLDIAVTSALVVTLAAYIWSAKAHFRSDRLAPGARAIAIMVFVGAATIALFVWTVEQSPWLQIAGFAVQIGTFVLFWATIAATRKARLLAAFTDGDPHSLVTTGPYRYMRHPFYTSYILFWFGSALATGVWWVLIVPVIMFVLYWRATIDEEARFAKTAMASDYATFKRGRARFFPGLF